MNSLKRKTDKEGEDVDVEANPAKAAKYAAAATETALEKVDPFVQALEDIYRACEKAIALGKESLIPINARLIAGLKTGQDPRVIQAHAQFSTITADLEAVACDIASKVRSAPIYKLPSEILELIFKHLDLVSLLSCQGTCRSWESILASSAARSKVWSQAPAVLKGTLAETDAIWRKITGELLLTPLELLLSLWQSPSDKKLDGSALRTYLKETKLARDFPRWLRVFKFYGDLRFHETKFWDFIPACTHLEVLHWDAQGDPGCEYSDSRYDIGYTDLRLEEFKFNSDMRMKIDMPFVNMLSQVKRLHFVSGLGAQHILAILSVAEDHLEDLSIIKVGSSSGWVGCTPKDIKTSFLMTKLRSFTLLSACISDLSISAPNATSVRFGNGTLIDWTLLDSCRNVIKRLHIELGGIKTDGRFGQEIFDMPQLESLHLNYKRREGLWSYDLKKESIIVDYRDFSAAGFWNAVLWDRDNTKRGTILPKLQTLTIIHDPLLNESTILKYFEMRSLLGQPALKEVKVFLANHCSDSTSALDAYKMTNPGLDHRRFEDWKDKETREWSLLTELEYLTIKWDELDVCRPILKKLRIDLSLWNPDKRLRQELFNMPQLEDLDTDFKLSPGKGKKRSLVALWTSYLSGSTGKEDVTLQDMLPRLQKLTITNDALLNEEAIIAMLETRKRLDLAPIETITINLASECSDSFEELESHAAATPGLAYKRFEDWWIPPVKTESQLAFEEAERALWAKYAAELQASDSKPLVRPSNSENDDSSSE